MAVVGEENVTHNSNTMKKSSTLQRILFGSSLHSEANIWNIYSIFVYGLCKGIGKFPTTFNTFSYNSEKHLAIINIFMSKLQSVLQLE